MRVSMRAGSHGWGLNRISPKRRDADRDRATRDAGRCGEPATSLRLRACVDGGCNAQLEFRYFGSHGVFSSPWVVSRRHLRRHGVELPLVAELGDCFVSSRRSIVAYVDAGG